jgi:hypothetical protein
MDEDDSKDEVVRRATAASLEGPGRRRVEEDVVDLTCDSDDGGNLKKTKQRKAEDTEEDSEALLEAIALSLQTNAVSSPKTHEKVKRNDNTSIGGSNLGQARASYGIPGLDRKKQEEERLARMAKKRKATSTSPSSTTRESKITKSQPSFDGARHRPMNAASRGRSLQTNLQMDKEKATLSSRASPLPKTALQFPKGAVRKTWAYGYPRADDIKIEEVLQKTDLKLAVLSSFQWDLDWLFSKVNIPGTRLLLLMQAKDDATVR